jgi:hypothetical protein
LSKVYEILSTSLCCVVKPIVRRILRSRRHKDDRDDLAHKRDQIEKYIGPGLSYIVQPAYDDCDHRNDIRRHPNKEKYAQSERQGIKQDKRRGSHV